MKASIYNASAGSGKTYRLAYKYVRDLIEEPTLYRNILAVTFTNKATEEMKRRIVSQIHTLAEGEKSAYMEPLTAELNLSPAQIQARALEARTLILHNYSRFTVLTIDKFFQRVLRAFIQEIGIDIGYNLEIESSSIVAQSADALIEQITTNKSLRQWLMALVQERIDEGRKWSVREGILALEKELFKEQARAILADNSSKEELQQSVTQLEQRAQGLKGEVRSIADTALERISSEGLTCDDFKLKTRSIAQIFRKISVASPSSLPEISDNIRRNYRDVESWITKSSPYGALSQQLIDMLSQIIDHYSEINTATLLRENYRSFALMYDLYHMTQEICHEQNTMLLSETPRILETFIRESDAPFIYEKVGNRYSHFMIDEFQDTSRREWNNFLPLLRDTIAQSKPDEKRVLIVGDIKQSIYRWRGGDWKILHKDAAEQLGSHNTEVINMVDNYRSLPNIVRFNNEIISAIVAEENTTLNGELDQSDIDPAARAELYGIIPRAYSDHAQNPKREGEGYVEVTTYRETPPMVERICEALDGGFKPCDIMVLTRSNSDASKAAQTLLEFKRHNRDTRYQFDVMTQEALIVGYAPISNFIVAALHLAIDEEESLQRAIYNRFLNKKYIDTPLDDGELEFMRSIRMLSPIEAFEGIVMQYDLNTEPRNVAYIQAIHEQVITYCKSKIGDIALFLEWWHDKGAKQSLRVEKSDKAIEILTIHKAKGLEKKVVIIPYCNWKTNPMSSGRNKNIVWTEGAEGATGNYPIQYKKEMQHSAFASDYFREKIYTRIDNINTLYVALTRAVEQLHIFVKISKKGVGEGIGALLLGNIPAGATTIEREQQTSYQFGEPSAPTKVSDSKDRRELCIMSQYISNTPSMRLRLPSQRYTTQMEHRYTPREIGIAMHRAFEHSHSRSEILAKVESMLKSGEIDAQEHSNLKIAIAKALSNPLAAEWFDTNWDEVRNEAEIIEPRKGENRRPDRVMIRDREAIVVDYKFGERHSGAYIRQMRQYIELLNAMGYQSVRGYVWYILSDEIVEVE